MPRQDILADAMNNYNRQMEVPYAMVKGDPEQLIAMPGARTLQENTAVRRKGWEMERVLESFPTAESLTMEMLRSSAAYGRPGVHPLALRAWWDAEGGTESRLMVAGSAEMASSLWFERAANRDFLAWSMNWLTGRKEHAEKPEEREWIDRRLKLSEREGRAAAWLGLAALPLMWVLAGAFVWWARKD